MTIFIWIIKRQSYAGIINEFNNKFNYHKYKLNDMVTNIKKVFVSNEFASKKLLINKLEYIEYYPLF